MPAFSRQSANRGRKILSEPDYTIAAPPPLDGHQRIHVVVVDQRCEVVFNGKRVFYGTVSPPEEDRKLAILLHTVGMKNDILDYTWRTAGVKKR